jgi:hypothetical protein
MCSYRAVCRSSYVDESLFGSKDATTGKASARAEGAKRCN